MANRKAFIESFLGSLEEILPSNGNDVFYKEYLESISDKAFDELVVRIEQGEIILPLIVPNLSESKLNIQRNLDTAKRWGHEFFQRINIASPQNPELKYLSPVKYLIIDLPVRRQAQTIESKMSVPKDSSVVDDLTAQVTGPSKGSRTTFPEIQILNTHGLDNTIVEFLKVRGGDTEAYQSLEQSILETGSARLADIKQSPTRVKSTETLSALLKAAHLDNNL